MEKRNINAGERTEAEPLGRQLGIEDEEYVLIFLNDESPLYFEYCEIYWNGKSYELSGFKHIGFSEDSVVMSTDLLEREDLPEVDFRYFAKTDNLIQFYMWFSSIRHIYVKNNGREKITIDTDYGIFVVEPGEYVFHFNMRSKREFI